MQPGEKPIREILREGWTHLEEKGVSNAKKNAEWMLLSILCCSSLDLYVNSDRVLSSDQVEQYHALLQRRAEREPLQYIIGNTEFMSLPFKVRPGVFIPRPDTEVLVEQVEAKLTGLPGSTRVLDLCTGAGVIAVTIAVRLPNTEVIGVDSSEEAIALAKENAVLNGVASRARFVRSAAGDFCSSGDNAFQVVVCNPPYIPTGEIPKLPPEIVDHEPREALDGGAEGLDHYEEIIPLLDRWITPGGYSAFEIGPAQGDAVVGLLEASGFFEISVFQDYTHRDRVVIGRRPL